MNFTSTGLVKTIIEYSLSFLCLFLCLYITIEVIRANTEGRPPRIFNISVSYVPTASMEPTINSNDYVMFVGADFNSVAVNDIIVYKSNTENKYIIHRVIEKYEDYLITQGDNNPIPDSEKITPDMVYGRYVMTLGLMSTIFSGGISQNIIFIILVVIFVIMIIMQMVSIVIKNKTEKLKNDIEAEKEQLREELKKEILEEELRKIKEQNNKKE